MNLSPDALKRWPVVGSVLTLILLAALSLAYWDNYQDRQRYLQSRNFRLIAVLAGQTESLINNRARIVREALAAGRPGVGLDAAAWIAATVKDPKAAKELKDISLTDAGVEGVTASANDVARTLNRYRASVAGEGTTLRIRLAPPDPKTLPTVTVTMPARAALGANFASKLNQGAFDTLVLATSDGRVVYAAGRRADELYAMSLASLVPPPAGGRESDGFRRLSATIAERTVQIAGVDYRMFVQPCYRGDRSGETTSPTGLAIVGLVPAEALFSASLAISPVLVLGGIALVLTALVGWSFLKIALIGPQQRVTRTDVLLLAVSSVFGLALATILLLSTSAYARLSADVDAQLKELAEHLNTNLTGEIDDAYSQADALIKHLGRTPCSTEQEVLDCNDVNRALAKDVQSMPQRYPGFTAFSLIDDAGMQRVKVASDDNTQRRISVADRAYFTQARDGHAWELAQCPGGCVLESTWSWITGKPQVSLSTKTDIEGLPVAAISIPLNPLIKPVLPPGFEFAVIDAAGEVQFHSDNQRNVHENLLIEADQNQRLKSIISAHRAGTLNTSYWGRRYRAYVRPTIVPGWSIVTLHDKQHTRALVLEWTAVSLLLQGVFMALWTIGVAVALRMNTSWLWPDPLRRPWYPVLSWLSVAGLLLWGLVAYRYGLAGAATLGILLPAGLWMVTCAVLYRPLPEGEKPKAWSQLRRDYRLAGALLLTATAVVPGASFFALSYDMHVGGFLKGRQIALARAVDGGAPCKSGWTGDDPVAMRARYDEVFYKSVTCLKGETPIKTPAEEAAEAESEPWGIHSLVEEYLPYYTSTSIETRELLHDHANDNTWVSTRLPDGQMTVDVAARAPGYRVKVQSPVPAALGIRSLGERPRIVWAAVMALAVLIVGLVASVRWIMNYLLRHVLLADIVEPARPKLPVELAVGQNLLVICDDPAAQAKALTENSEASIFELTRILTAENPGAEWRRTRVALGSANTVAPLVIHDVTDAMDDPALMLKKLALVDQLMGDLEQTVVLLTKYPTYVLAAAAKDAARGNADSDRWPKLVARLTVIDIRTSPQSQQELSGTAAVVSWRERLAQLWAAWTKPPAEDWQSELISVEAGRNRKLRRICEELQRTLAFQSRELTCEQILEELAERAAPYYQRLWQGCDPDERVVLEHVAQYGLASAASRRVVRRLLGKGLLRKDPNLRLMNQSFQRFVLTAECRSEVAALEELAEPSVWDRLRLPLGLTSLATVLFLVITQREAFDATVAMAAGVTTAVPTLVRLTNFLTQLGGRGNTPPTANA